MPRPSELAQGPRDSALAASEIQKTILRERACLPKALNGEPIACSDPRAITTRKHMKQELCVPVRHLLTVSVCDVHDGVPLATAIAPYRQMIAFLQLTQPQSRPRELSQLELEETKAQGELDIAQHKVRATPDGPDALRAVIAALARYEAAAEALRQHYETRLMIAAGTTQRPRAVELATR